MIPKSLNTIALLDLQRLVEEAVRESRTMEYKQDFPSGQSKDKVHFLRAVTSMANSGGGDVIYGIEAKDGVPVEVCGITLTTSYDEAQLRLENLMREAVQPRLQAVGFRWVEVGEGKVALVVRVRNSWNGPHRVLLENHNHFYGRNSAGAYPMDVSELRAAFLLSDSVGGRMRDFRAERLMRVEAGRTPVPFGHGAVAVVHILPVSAFSTSHGAQLDATRELVRPIHLLGDDQRPSCFSVNIDGVVGFESRDADNGQYAQMFRNGCLELVASDPWAHLNSPLLRGKWVVFNFIKAISHNIVCLRALGIDAPYVVSISFVRVKGYQLSNGNHAHHRQPVTLVEDVLVLPDLIIEDIDSGVAKTLRPTFNILWNAFGFEECPFFDDNGELMD
jgi:hypothetical protein